MLFADRTGDLKHLFGNPPDDETDSEDDPAAEEARATEIWAKLQGFVGAVNAVKDHG